MIAGFADLLERLAFTPRRNLKLAHLTGYFKTTPDPDRGYALAALTGDLELRRVTPSLLRGLVSARIDAELFALSYDFVGDLAETIALIWPEPTRIDSPALADLVRELRDTPENTASGADHRAAGQPAAVTSLCLSETRNRRVAGGRFGAAGAASPCRFRRLGTGRGRGTVARPLPAL